MELTSTSLYSGEGGEGVWDEATEDIFVQKAFDIYLIGNCFWEVICLIIKFDLLIINQMGSNCCKADTVQATELPQVLHWRW